MKTHPTPPDGDPLMMASVFPMAAKPATISSQFTPRHTRSRSRAASLLPGAAGVAAFLMISGQGATVSGPVPDTETQPIADRGDIINLPGPLKTRIIELAGRPHTYRPLRIFAEADSPSLLFGYYLLDTGGFEPNIFTTTIPGINDGVAPTATGPNGDLPTIASVRLVVEPKPGLPTNPNNPGAFIDISGLFVINNESGW